MIGFWENGDYATGNYILIFRWGNFYVGEVYMKDGKRLDKGTVYRTDEEEEEYDL